MRRYQAAPGPRIAAIAVLILCVGCASPTAPADPTDTSVPDRLSDRSAHLAIEIGLSTLGVEAGDERLLLMTNAGYARPNGCGTEFFADVATRASGCSIGKRSLYFLHSPATADLWFAVYRRDNRQAFFGKRFSGDAALSTALETTGTDPYGRIRGE